MQQTNRAVLLDIVRKQSPTTRARLSDLTGLTRSAISNLVDELIDSDMIREAGQEKSGIGRPGNLLELNPAGGSVIAVKFMNWRDASFRAAWEAEYGVPVSVDNLTKLAALGESRFGSAIAESHFIYIEIGYGVGAGIVINHQIYQGKNGMAGEVGYMQSYAHEKSGAPTHWEELVNIPSFLRAARRLIESGRQTSLTGADLSFGALTDALRKDDPVACQALRELCRHLGMGLASLANSFDIPVFILGGELGIEYEACLQQLLRDTEQFLVPQAPGGVDIRISRMQPDASLMGAAARVFDTVLIEPSLPVNF